MICLLLVLWGGALLLWWKYKIGRIICFTFAGAVLLLIVFPGRQPDTEKLRAAYLKCLRSYEGTKYVWGGENHFGIDCSGLVRRGLIDACLKEGIKTFNPLLLRQSFLMRWYDCTANALEEGYRNQTRPLFRAPSIQTLDHSKLRPGDLATTGNGVHILAYLGDETWIEADPGLHRVIVAKASDDNPWFNSPIVALRWRILE